MCKEEARGVVGSKRGRCVGVASLIRHEQKQKGWIRHIRPRTRRGHSKENKVWEYRRLFLKIFVLLSNTRPLSTIFSPLCLLAVFGLTWYFLTSTKNTHENSQFSVVMTQKRRRTTRILFIFAHNKTNFNGDIELKVFSLSFHYMFYRTGGRHPAYTVITHTNLLPLLSISPIWSSQNSTWRRTTPR